MNTKENNNVWNNKRDNYNVERAQILEALIEQYKPMLYQVANNMLNRWGATGDNTNPVCEREDLLQEGCVAIIKAYDSYDDNKKASLTTWVHTQIEWSMMEYMKKNFSQLGSVNHLHAAMQKVKKMGYEPTIENLVEFGGVSKKTAMASTYAFLRPSSAGGASSGLRRKDEDELMKQPEASYMQKEYDECLRLEYEKFLDPKESMVLTYYYGLRDKPQKTMGEIGKEIGKSRKAVSYMLNTSIQKLKHQPGIEHYYWK